MTVTGKRPFTVKLLAVLHGFLGIGAVFGGGALVIDPSGQMLGMPTDIMQLPVFPDYLIPGIILLLVLGLAPLGIMISLLLRREWRLGEKLNLFRPMHWSWSFSLYVAFALIIWIMVQLYIIKTTEWIHLVYVALGLAIQVVTLLPSVRNHFEIGRESGQGITMN
ncbi:hypothetical protein V3851_17250 [Paenibacillus sp. M1]|uniref:DUF2269 family protein n=1 Tax=Paenibacillus haidiansis TaxID=1574488 RepID=A0ABU7VXC6_9BACL